MVPRVFPGRCCPLTTMVAPGADVEAERARAGEADGERSAIAVPITTTSRPSAAASSTGHQERAAGLSVVEGGLAVELAALDATPGERRRPDAVDLPANARRRAATMAWQLSHRSAACLAKPRRKIESTAELSSGRCWDGGGTSR